MNEKIKKNNHMVDLDELFQCKTIYIYGVGEVSDSIVEILNYYKINKECNNNIIRLEQGEACAFQKKFSSSIKIKNSCLILANIEGKINNEIIYLVKMGFATIIDGYQLVQYFYNPLTFRIAGAASSGRSEIKDDIQMHWKKATSLNKIILLNYIGRSGSYYFMTLLEHHPKLIVMPFKSIYNPKIILVALKYCYAAEINIDELISAFKIKKNITYNQQMIKFKVGKDNQIYPKEYENIYIDMLKKIILEEAYINGGIVEEAFLLKAQYYSHMLAIGMDMNFDSGIPYIVEQIHTIDINLIQKYREQFPKCIQIATVRHTVNSFGSLLAGMERMRMLSPAVIYNIMEVLITNPAISDLEIARDSALIRIEDINDRPEEVLKLLCDYLEIPWNDILLKNTLNGKIFYDSYDFNLVNIYKTGPRKEGMQKTYQEYLSTFDKFRLEVIFYWSMKEFGYDVHEYRKKEVVIELFKEPFRFENRMKFKSDESQIRFRKKLESMCTKYFIEMCNNEKPEYLNLIKIIK